MTKHQPDLGSLTVGLFGTCETSRWREAFIARYKDLGIPFYNPQVPAGTWVEEMATEEAWHLANDQLLLFPVTDESYAAGSLGETGFSILSALRWNANRFVVMFIAPDVAPELYVRNKEAADNSRRARALVLKHLATNQPANVFVVKNLDEMLEVSLKLFAALRLISCARASDGAGLSPDQWLELVRMPLATPELEEQANKVLAGA